MSIAMSRPTIHSSPPSRSTQWLGHTRYTSSRAVSTGARPISRTARIRWGSRESSDMYCTRYGPAAGSVSGPANLLWVS